MSKPKVVDLFCGAGGASMGFVRAGYEVVGAVDADETALDTYKENLCGDQTVIDEYLGEVRFDEPLRADLSRGYIDDEVDEGLPEITFEDIRGRFDLEPGEVDVICGCPPCQNFSSLRDTEPWPEEKPKDNLLRAFVEFIEEEVPDVVFFENVRNIMTAGDDVPSMYVDWLKRSMSDITREGDSEDEGGYGVALDVLNTADYGVPQRRDRTIGLFVYGKDDEEMSLPEQTHAEEPWEDSTLQEWVSVNEALGRHDDLKQNIESGEKQIDVEGYPDDPEHRSRRHQKRSIERMEAIRRHGWGWRDLKGTDDEEYIVKAHRNLESGADAAYGIMDGEVPAPTLTTRCTTPSSGRFTHPRMNRALTAREAALLMTFPRWFKLPDQNDAAERVVGNAVPPLLVERVAESILDVTLDPVTAD
ncbi:DNA cytosine methyltransferase [Haloarchaeobius sp. DFWS5]|uniref:DNA cytosine methyltransferase n=1 Tax=Haloarchaeobius sp. DFWS5 TaxID=3446114 RepID=UPI003EB753CB